MFQEIFNRYGIRSRKKQLSLIKGYLANTSYRGKWLDGIWQGFVGGDGRIDDSCLSLAIADYLVLKGMPFRTAHNFVSEMNDKMSKQGKHYYDLSLKDFKKYSGLFEEDVFSIASIPGSMDKKNWKELEKRFSKEYGENKKTEELDYIPHNHYQIRHRNITLFKKITRLRRRRRGHSF